MSENVVIRPMGPEDLEAVACLERDCFSAPWKKEDFRETLDKSHCCFLVARTADGALAGYCGFYQGGPEGEITNVAVDRSLRRKGVARQLLCQLMDEGVRRGVDSFILEVRKGNEGAIALYEGLGFQIAGVRKNFYRYPTEDGLVMMRSAEATGKETGGGMDTSRLL